MFIHELTAMDCHGNKADDLYFDNTEGTLHWAAMQGDVDVVEEILKSDPHCVDVRNEDSKTALLCAAEHGQTHVIKKLLEFDADPFDGCHDDHISSLHAAAGDGYNDAVKILLDRGVDVDITDNNGNTPLFMAIIENKPETVDLLIKNAAEINGCNHAGLTPLEIAINEEHVTIAKLLLENGASIEKEGSSENHLHLAVLTDNAEMVGLVLEWATTDDINAKDEVGSTPLHRACATPDSQVIGRLLDYDVTDVTSADISGLTCLHHCAETGDDEGAELLIQRGAKIDPVDCSGNTPLCLASMQGEMFFCDGSINRYPDSHLEIVKVLVNEGADVNHKNRCGNSPLMLALERGCIKVATILIGHDSNVVLQDSIDKNTPLHYAVRHKDKAIVKAVVKRGAELNIKNSRHISPIELLPDSHKDCCLIFHILLSNGAIYRRSDLNISLSSFVRKTKLAFYILLSHGASICELLSSELSVKTHWHGDILAKFAAMNSFHTLCKQQPYPLSKLAKFKTEENYQKNHIELVAAEKTTTKKCFNFPSLMNMCIISLREYAVHAAQGKSIWKSISLLKIPSSTKQDLLLVDLDESGFIRHLLL